MSLYTLYGINGIGKDTLANQLQKRNPEIEITSMSKLYMYILGITKTYYTSEKVNEKQYKLLESVSQEEMMRIENNEYKDFLKKITMQDNDVIFLGHLVSALRLGDHVNYLTDRKTQLWFLNMNKSIIQLLAPSEIICNRRLKDTSRIREADCNEIVYHQNLCFEEWKRLMNICGEKLYCVENLDREEAILDLENIIFDNNKKLTKEKSEKVLNKYLKKE